MRWETVTQPAYKVHYNEVTEPLISFEFDCNVDVLMQKKRIQPLKLKKAFCKKEVKVKAQKGKIILFLLMKLKTSMK